MADVVNATSLEVGERNGELDHTAEDAEFDAVLEQAALSITEMARQARELRRAGQTRKFPA